MDILQTLGNLLLITILGLLIAFSPMIVMVNLFIILKSDRPILRSIVLMCGVIAPLLIVTIIAMFVVKPDTHITLRGLSQTINLPPLFDFVFGMWLLIVAARQWGKAKHFQGIRKTPKILEHPPDGLVALFGFAFAKSVLSVTNLFAILILVKFLITNAVSQSLSLFAFVWVLLVGLIPFAVILYFYFFRHEKLELLSGGVDNLLKRNVSAAFTIILGCTGCYFVLEGLIGAL